MSCNSLTLIDWRSIRSIIGFHCQSYWPFLLSANNWKIISRNYYLNDAKGNDIQDAEHAADKTLKEIKQGIAKLHLRTITSLQNAADSTSKRPSERVNLSRVSSKKANGQNKNKIKM